MKDIISQIVPEGHQYIKHGQVDEYILRELQMSASLHKYIEFVTDWYDEIEAPYFNNWTDIEGMGYGWRWMNYKEEDWHKMMFKIVKEESETLLRDWDITLYFVYKNDSVLTYHFITLNGGVYRTDHIFSLSHEEIDYF